MKTIVHAHPKIMQLISEMGQAANGIYFQQDS